MVIYEEKSVQQHIRHIFSKMGLCDCGSGTSYAIVLKLLERAAAMGEGEATKGTFYDPLENIPADIVEFIAHAMTGWNLLEHGSSIGFAWLTEDGKMLLDFLRKHGTDSDAWPEWWCSCNIDEEW